MLSNFCQQTHVVLRVLFYAWCLLNQESVCRQATTLLTEQPSVVSLLERTVATHFGQAASAGTLAAAELDWYAVGPSEDHAAAWPASCRGSW